MHTAPLNKHGLPILHSRDRPKREHHVLTMPPHIEFHDPSCYLLTRHTVDHTHTRDACLERRFENMIWRTY